MDQDIFVAVDEYIDQLFVPEDAALEAARQSAVDAGLPEIQVSRGQGKLLHVLARLCGARRILELGTLGGYSAIWLGRALPSDGRLISLELDPHHAEVARASIARAGLDDRVEVIVGPALDSLVKLTERGVEPFDMVFIDADKVSYPAYLEQTLPLIRPGGLLAADNVVRAGKVLDPDSDDESVRGAATFNAALAADPRVESLVLQQVGAKGHDGLAIAVVKK